MKDWFKQNWIFALIIILSILSILTNESNNISIKANIIMKDKGIPIMRYENVEIFQDDSLRLSFNWNGNIVVIIKNIDTMKIDIEEIENEK